MGPSVIDVSMPRLGETMEEGRIVAWLKQPGDVIRRGETVVEVETDKTIVEVPSLEDGVLVDILAGPDSMAAVGQPIARLAVERAASPAAEILSDPDRSGSSAARPPSDRAATAPEAAPARDGTAIDRPRASPAARRLARRAGIDLADLAGTGRRGRICGDDVRAAVAGAGGVVRPPAGLAVRRLAAGRADTAPAVLIHGLFGDADTFGDLARRIGARGRPVLGLDLPGHGRTTSDETDPEAIVRAVLETVRSVAPGPVRLVGHSFGGVVATRVAAALGQSVERLVLVAPAGLGPELDQGFVDGMLAVRTPVDLRRELDRLGPDPTAMSQSWLDDQVDRLVRRRDPLAALAAAIVRDGRQRIDITADVDGLACPVTAVFGLADTVVPWQHATRLPARAAIHFVRDAGHMPHRAAADLVAALVDG